MSTVTLKFDDVEERIWMLESMGRSLSSKVRFMECEKVAPDIAPSNELIERAKVQMTQNGPIWDKAVDTSVTVDVHESVIEGVRDAVFSPNIMTPITSRMIEKFSLWTLH